MNTLNRIVLAVIALFSLTALNAQDKSLLYEVSKPGLETSYLYGTIHLMPEAKFKISPQIRDAFAKAEKIILELDMDDPTLQSQTMQEVLFTNGEQLSDLFTAQERKLIDSTLTKHVGTNLAALNTMKPFILNSVMLPIYFGEKLASYEGTFTKWAKEQEKDIKGLETVAEQMNAINFLSYEEQADRIVEALVDKAELQKMFDKMLDLYLKGDAEGLYGLFDSYYDGNEEMIAAMLDKRNIKWIPELNKHLAEGSSFIGVGAGHLGGENGVLNLLRKEGYTVRPVSTNTTP